MIYPLRHAQLSQRDLLEFSSDCLYPDNKYALINEKYACMLFIQHAFQTSNMWNVLLSEAIYATTQCKQQTTGVHHCFSMHSPK